MKHIFFLIYIYIIIIIKIKKKKKKKTYKNTRVWLTLWLIENSSQIENFEVWRQRKFHKRCHNTLSCFRTVNCDEPMHALVQNTNCLWKKCFSLWTCLRYNTCLRSNAIDPLKRLCTYPTVKTCHYHDGFNAIEHEIYDLHSPYIFCPSFIFKN